MVRLQLIGTATPLLATLFAASPGIAQDEARPVFEDGQAQVVPAFKEGWIRHALWVETEFDTDGDGRKDRMHVDVTRPGQTDTAGLKVAVIYETSPYYKGTAGPSGRSIFWNTEHELGEEPPERSHGKGIPYNDDPTQVAGRSRLAGRWVPRGFAVVHSCSPGTGMSQGCPTIGAENEALAPKAVIDWLNGRAKGYDEPYGGKPVEAYWSTGKVGMTGTSYNGTLPLAAATTGVDGLEAIIPIAPNTSYYHYYRSHGLIRHPGGYMGEDIDVLYDFVASGNLEYREYCDENVRDGDMMAGFDRITGDYNDFWAGRDYGNQLAGVKAAVLMAHAFNDWNVMPEHSVRIYEALKQRGLPTMAYFHQGGHGGPPPMRLQNLWFSRYLYGVDNKVEDLPRAWIVREGDREPTAYAEYPNPDAAAVELFPGGQGNAHGSLGLTAAADRGTQTVVDDVAHTGGKLAASESSPHRLLFVTPELKAPLHLSGTSTLKIRVASSKPAANLSVWLVSLPWTNSRRIYDNVITRGWADPQNRNDPRTSSPLQPGEFVELEFTLQPDDHVVPAGQHVGLMIFSSDREFTLWPDAGTELSVDLGGTSLFLPIVGGRSAYENAIGAL